MVSPLMAFAKGAFEGYNQIKEEERAAAAELASTKQTATAKAMAEGNFYTSVGEGGLQTHGFQLSEAKNQGDRYVENIQNFTKHLSPGYMTYLQENDTQRYNSIMGDMYSNISRYKKLEGQTLESGVELIPKAKIMPDILANPYWGPHLAKVFAGNVDGTYTVSYEDGDNIAVKNERPDFVTHGFNGTEDFNKFAFFHANRKNDTSVTTPEQAGSVYWQKYSKIAPLYVSNLLVRDGENISMMQSAEGKSYTVGMALEEIAKGGIVDQNLIDNLDVTIQHWNQTAGKDAPITNNTLIKGLQLAASNSHDMSGQSDSYNRMIEGNKGGVYLKEVLELDVEQIGSKVNAAREAKTTVGNIRKVFHKHLKLNQHPPSSDLANNVIQFYSAFFEEGNIGSQLSSIKDRALKQFGVDVSDSALTIIAESHKAIESAGTNKQAKDGAILEFYTNMLAYQLAVAIQGGTGGRTVSDQDVINMKNAFGKRLFSNGVVQLAVLNEIDGFLSDVVDTNKFLLQARDGSVSDAKAANALHKIKAGGLDLKSANDPFSSIATERFGEQLDKRITAGINSGSVVIINQPTGFTTSGTADKQMGDANYGVTLPQYDRILDDGKIGDLKLHANTVTELGQRLWIANELKHISTPGVKEFYVNTGREDSNGAPIVELASGYTEEDVTKYFRKLRKLTEDSDDEKVSGDSRFILNNFKGIN